MRNTVCLCVSMLLLVVVPAAGQSPAHPQPLRSASNDRFWLPPMAAARYAGVPVSGRRQTTSTRVWIKEHPVLAGTTIGLATGLVIGAARGNSGDFTTGAHVVFYGGIGAGVGAMVGGIIGTLRKQTP